MKAAGSHGETKAENCRCCVEGLAARGEGIDASDGPPSFGFSTSKVADGSGPQRARRSGVDMSGMDRIAAERKRQVNEEGWTAEHDAEHTDGELAMAAACYAMPKAHRDTVVCSSRMMGDPSDRGDAHWVQPRHWPFDGEWWKPTRDRIRELEKAGALIAAEIDRLLLECGDTP